jgi:acetyl esterase/lipase
MHVAHSRGQNQRVPLFFTIVAVLGAIAILNALRPLKATVVVLPAFFSAWLTVELAPQLIVLTVLFTGGSAALGALEGIGWYGGALMLLNLAGLVWMVRQSQRAADVADAALRDWVEPVPEEEVKGLLRRFFVPMAFSHPDVERVVDLPYSEVSKRHRLDVYHRKDLPAGAPTLIQVHGGAWVIGDKREQGRPLMLHLARQGWVCFAPNYRLSPRATFPDHLIDVKRAIAWVRENGHRWGADPGFLVLTGGSAGGQLSTLCALTQNDPEYQPGFEDADTSVQGCIPYYGVYDLEAETGTKAAKLRRHRLLAKLVMKTRDDEAYAKASPLARAAQRTPPTFHDQQNPKGSFAGRDTRGGSVDHEEVPAFFVIHGRNDTLVPVEEARLLVERLRAMSDQPVIYLELPGTQHAFDVFPSIRSDHVVRAVGRFCEYLRKTRALSR